MCSLSGMESNDNQVIFYWPYCPDCKQPIDFDTEGPWAYCNCGTMEWGYPRPADWIEKPFQLLRQGPNAT